VYLTLHASILAVEELAKALAAQLNAPPTAAERHLAELGFLASLVQAAPLLNGEIPMSSGSAMTRCAEWSRPATPRSALLVERYGAWVVACRAASGLLPDGRNRGTAAPFPSWVRGQRKEDPYTKQEVAAAVLECQREYGRPVSSHEFMKWRHQRSTNLRARGRRPRLPTQCAIYRVFGVKSRKDRGGWRKILHEIERGLPARATAVSP
jgi:hypothetical protein